MLENENEIVLNFCIPADATNDQTDFYQKRNYNFLYYFDCYLISIYVIGV